MRYLVSGRMVYNPPLFRWLDGTIVLARMQYFTRFIKPFFFGVICRRLNLFRQFNLDTIIYLY